MNNYISNKRLNLFLILVAVQSMAANLAHPITPTFIKELALPDYMFGVLFASMSFTNFLFSPFWARIVTRIGSKKTLFICCSGYGLGQFLLMLSSTIPTIIAARVIAGFFVGGVMVSYLSYIINKSQIEVRGKYLALSATFATVFGAFGYLVGGLIGVYSLPITFIVQAIMLVLSGFSFYLFLDEDKCTHNKKFRIVKDSNPFSAFMDSKHFMNKLLAVLFFVVFLTSVASTAFDQSFNFYIKDAFNFNSSYNGILKAVVGFISLFVNTTICLWLIRNTDVKKSLIYIFLGASVSLLMIFLLDEIAPFILVSILFFAFDAIYVPLIQGLCADQNKGDGNNEVIGFYNAMKSLGMIFGALYAGAVYGFGPKLAFLSAGVFFVIAAIMMYRYQKGSQRIT